MTESPNDTFLTTYLSL